MKKFFNYFLISILIVSLSLSIATIIFSENVDAKTIDIDSNLKNNDIQSIINNATEGDKILFNGNQYKDINLIITKKLIIESQKNTKLIGLDKNTQGENFKSVIHFKKGSEGSTIKGFNIQGIQYGITAINTGKITISNNDMANSKTAGIAIYGSKEVMINNNKIYNNQIGIILNSSNNTKVLNNNIINNAQDGIYILNTVNTNISHNNLDNNLNSTIGLHGTTIKTLIYYNNLTRGSRGIYGNAHEIGDAFIGNVIRYNTNTIPAEDGGDTGCGIGFTSRNLKYYLAGDFPIIKYNNFYGNPGHSVMAPSSVGNNRIDLDSNWYGTNSENKQDTHLCAHYNSNSIQAKLEKTNKGLKIAFYDGNSIARGLAPIQVTGSINGKTFTFTVENGEMAINYEDYKDLFTDENGDINDLRVDLQADSVALFKFSGQNEIENMLATGNNPNNNGKNGENGYGSGIGENGNNNGNNNGNGFESSRLATGNSNKNNTNELLVSAGMENSGGEIQDNENVQSNEEEPKNTENTENGENNAKIINIDEINKFVDDNPNLVYIVAGFLAIIIVGSYFFKKSKK
ncbi:MAG: right-handed parallel beta-helix repeat-containing protein [Methanobrevibacter sp.]|jgi:parallel beta-helix repeat protein|nr:right-handed parallel beta-helix repeat-containing protein [Candidatus Methanoflexus mossambicus]